MQGMQRSCLSMTPFPSQKYAKTCIVCVSKAIAVEGRSHIAHADHVTDAGDNLVCCGGVQPCADLVHEQRLAWPHHNLACIGSSAVWQGDCPLCHLQGCLTPAQHSR